MITMVSPMSALCQMAIELYDWHRGDRSGLCACRDPWCRVALNAAEVIRAAGLNPRQFDRPLEVPWHDRWGRIDSGAWGILHPNNPRQAAV